MEHEAIAVPARPVERRRVGLLVDGDNFGADFAGQMLVRAGRLGPVIVKRVYLDPHHLRNWEAAGGFSLQVVRGGRDAADKLLTIDAVDLSHRGDLGAFVIASSDGGYAPLARFLVERGLTVLGLGTDTAPTDWRRSCSRFEVLAAQGVARAVAPAVQKREPAVVAPPAAAGTACQSASLRPCEPRSAEGSSGAKDAALGPTDRLIRLLILTEGAEGSITIGRLGQLMGARDAGILDRLGVPRWRSYLESRPELYQLDARSAAARVRWLGP